MQRLATLALLALLLLPAHAEPTCQVVNSVPYPECFAVSGTSLPALVELEPGSGRPGR